MSKKTSAYVVLNQDQVLAALDERLKQIRIPLKKIRGFKRFNAFARSTTPQYDWQFRCHRGLWQDFRSADFFKLCPFGMIGDFVWAKEGFWSINETCDHEYCAGCDMGSLLDLGENYACVQYCATPDCLEAPKCEFNQTAERHEGDPVHGSWWLSPPKDWDGKSEEERVEKGVWIFLPSKFSTKHKAREMPEWASRIKLKISGVRVEKLRDLTLNDASFLGCPTELQGSERSISWYAESWDIQHGDQHEWMLNPWCWVLDVKTVKKEESS